MELWECGYSSHRGSAYISAQVSGACIHISPVKFPDPYGLSRLILVNPYFLFIFVHRCLHTYQPRCLERRLRVEHLVCCWTSNRNITLERFQPCPIFSLLALEIIISFTLMFVISGVATDNRAVSFFQELRSSFIRPSSTPNSTQNHRVWVDRVYFMVGLRLIFLVQPINKSTFIAFLILCNLASSFHKQIRIPSSKFFRLLNRIHL